MCELRTYLKWEGFYTSPASTKYHGCYEGGLAQHSYDVYCQLVARVATLRLGEVMSFGQKPLPIKPENLIVAALLHDVCKIGAYLGDAKPYKWNRAQPKGHALLSIERISQYIELEPIEELMIRYHMGLYGLHEFEGKGEYPLQGKSQGSKEDRYGKSLRNAWYHNPICKVIYFCDELATLSEKAREFQTAQELLKSEPVSCDGGERAAAAD